MGRLKDKVLIITGSAGGIGAACARRYAEEGAKVVVADILGDQAKEVADSIVAKGGEAIAVTADISDESSVMAMIDAAVTTFGRLDVLHNNAAYQFPEFLARDTTVAELDMDVLDFTLAVNLKGYVMASKHAIPHMVRQGGGSIINTSSRAGTHGMLGLTAYGISKAGVNALTQYIATQYGKQGIRANSLVIAAILTERHLNSTDEATRERTIRHLLTPALATPEQIANAALFLASDEAGFVTGSLMDVDGGWGMHDPRYADVMATGERPFIKAQN